MSPRPGKFDEAAHKQAMVDIARMREQRDKGYRARALKMYPHVCASCGREFSGRNLKELTVHHKDHDHSNNPPDGSNWELLCLYCHDHEHEKYLMKGHGAGDSPDSFEGSGFSLGDLDLFDKS